MFLGYQGEKIVLVANTKKELENNKFMKFDKIVKTSKEYVLYNGEYITAEQAAERQAAAEKAAHIAQLQAQLDALDLKAIRALRAIQAGTGTEADSAKLAALEAQAEEIRKQIKELQ